MNKSFFEREGRDMAESNRDRVARGLELLSQGVYPFLEREMKSKLGERWQDAARDAMRDTTRKINWNDPQVLLSVLWDQWNAVFRDVLGPAERSLVSELRDWRNRWAHN